MSSAEEENNLTAKECQERINQFIEVTNTDEAEAQSVLQDHDWNLEAAINAFLGANQADKDVVVTTKPPSTLSMITWNIDGLDDKNLSKRIAFIITELKKIKSDVVLLQEVTGDIAEELDRHLVEYHVIEQGRSSDGYYTCVLLRQTTIYLDEVKTKPFENSRMGRGIQKVFAHIGKVKLCFLNVHLESTKDFGKQRVEQLEISLSEMKDAKDEATFIMAGDLNIRDTEVASLSNGRGLPDDVNDVWEILGKRKDVQYTWDCLRNTNKQFPGKFKPRLRFDRVLIKHPSNRRVAPKTFNLIGIEKVPGTQSFPSDHWGILTTYELSQTD